MPQINYPLDIYAFIASTSYTVSWKGFTPAVAIPKQAESLLKSKQLEASTIHEHK